MRAPRCCNSGIKEFPQKYRKVEGSLSQYTVGPAGIYIEIYSSRAEKTEDVEGQARLEV